MKKLTRLTVLLSLLAPLALAARGVQPADSVFRADEAARRLAEAGFVNVRAVETSEFTAFTVENDYYKIPAEGFARAVQILEGCALDESKPVKLIGTANKVPEVTMTYDPVLGSWSTTKRLDASWDAVRGEPVLNDSFGQVDIVVYPVVQLKNLIITQVYQSLWQLNPAVETSLWPGGKISLQVKIPILNDGYGMGESLVHPGYLTVSQSFRDPWHLNIFGKLTAGVFNSTRYGAVLDLSYWFPNERFWVESRMGVVDMIRFGLSGNLQEKCPLPPGLEGFWMHPNATADFRFVWRLAANYYNPSLQTQFSLRAERYLIGDIGFRFEMIRHFRRCSVGFYAMKGLDPAAHTNGGFRFQVALPPYRQARHGRVPRITTAGQMGISYNANNEQYYYKSFAPEASNNIMSNNYYNPYYINSRLGR